MQYGLIGEHLPHSFSKTIHGYIADYDYELHEVAKKDIDTFMKARAFKAINVTIPYKQTVIPYLYEFSDRAKKIGAVNTIVNMDGKLYGDNTDFGGMEAMIKNIDLIVENKKVLILGTGGTSNTAYAVCEALKADEILKVSRSGKNGALTYEEMYKKHTNAQIIINTTPCGMYPKSEDRPVDLKKFTDAEGVLDVIYNPISSRLVLQARSLGLKAQGGLYMLVAQAVLASEIFRNTKLDATLIDEIYAKLLLEKRNIVLTGLPSSGKSTAGKRISQITGRKIFDSDEEIVDKEGISISEIFDKRGEPYFREIESEVIRELSKKNGVIIATGGGVPLRRQNIEALKTNGVIVFIDRDPDDLIPTKDRPLFDEQSKVKKLYEERYPIYMASADIHLKTDSGHEETGDEVYELIRAMKE